MSDHQAEQLFAKWLEGTLSEQEQRDFESLCIQDASFAERVETANQVMFTAEQFPDMPIPAWDMHSTMPVSEKTSWWHWRGLPALSMACSVVAILMVTTGFSVSRHNGTVTMGFGNHVDEQTINQVVTARLKEYQDVNQKMFAQYVAALHTQQQENSSQLTQYLLTSSRQERREDFAELIKFINEQRDDDQRFYARQLNSMQQEINALDQAYLTNPTLPNSNYSLSDE